MKPRRILFLIHLWSGLVLGAAAAFVALTGSLILFQPEIDRWLNPALMTVPAAAAPAPLEAVAAAGLGAYPGPVGFAMLHLAELPGRSHRLLMKEGFFEGAGGWLEAFIDPADARLLGTRDPQRTVVGTLIGLHVHWLAGEHSWGETAVGLVGGLMLLVFLGTGIALWWPGRGGWAHALRLRHGQGQVRLLRDLHRLSGVLAAPALLLAALTGLVLVFPDQTRPLVTSWAPLDAPPHLPAGTAGPRVTVDQAVAAARQGLPEARVTRVAIPSDGTGRFEIRLARAEDPAQHYSDGRLMVWVGAADGRVLARRDESASGLGSRLLEVWLFPTHTGEGGGIAGRVLMLGAGLVPAFLFASGLATWLERRRRRREAAAVPRTEASGQGARASRASMSASEKPKWWPISWIRTWRTMSSSASPDSAQ